MAKRKTPDAAIELADASTLAGDLRDAMLSRLRAQSVVWSRLSEAEQREEIRIAEEAAQSLIADAVRLIHGAGAPAIAARVKRATIRKDFEIVLAAARGDPFRHQLSDRVDETVMIVLADPNLFLGEAAPAAFDPDAPELDIDAPAKGKRAGRAKAERRPVTGGGKSAAEGGGGRETEPREGKIDASAIFKRPRADHLHPEEPAEPSSRRTHDPETGEVFEDE